jgi:hypothetical protein
MVPLNDFGTAAATQCGGRTQILWIVRGGGYQPNELAAERGQLPGLNVFLVPRRALRSGVPGLCNARLQTVP